ncbi:MAG: CvpA family protein [Clostridia bacterium]
MNIVDYIIIAILILCAIIGCYKGFIKSFLSVFSGFINVLLCIIATKPLAGFLNSTFGLENALSSSINTSLVNGCADFGTNMVGLTTQADINAHITNALNNGSKSGIVRSFLEGILKVTPENLANRTSLSISDILSRSLGTFLTLVISFILVFIVIMTVKVLLSALCKKVQKSSLSVFDRILGFVFGIVRGGAFVVIVLGILSFFTEVSFLSVVFKTIDTSMIGGWASGYVFEFMHKYINVKTILQAIVNQI